MTATLAVTMLEAITRDYREMPGLTVTVPQAARLWALETAVAHALLEMLVPDGFLARTDDGQYERASIE